MTKQISADATKLLGEWRDGDEASRDRLLALFYPWLRRAASGVLRDVADVSLSPGDLAHEAVIRLVRIDTLSCKDRAHFMAIAAKAMRHVLIDHLRAKKADKRAHRRVTLVTNLQEKPGTDFRKLHHCLQRLAAFDPEKAEIVEMRYFGGMTIEDVAEVTDLSPATVKKRWAIARAWLADAMSAGI